MKNRNMDNVHKFIREKEAAFRSGNLNSTEEQYMYLLELFKECVLVLEESAYNDCQWNSQKILLKLDIYMGPR